MSSITSEGNSPKGVIDFNCFLGLFCVGLGRRGAGLLGILKRLSESATGAFKEFLTAASCNVEKGNKINWICKKLSFYGK